MAETMKFDLVSPERRLASADVTEVQIPGAEGDMTAMADHAPVITTLRPGVLRAIGPEGSNEYIVTGGFAEISAAGVSVLAERAIPHGEMNQEQFDIMVQELRDAHERAKETFKNEPGPVDDAAKMLADMVALGGEIGLGAN